VRKSTRKIGFWCVGGGAISALNDPRP